MPYAVYPLELLAQQATFVDEEGSAASQCKRCGGTEIASPDVGSAALSMAVRWVLTGKQKQSRCVHRCDDEERRRFCDHDHFDEDGC